MDTKIVGESEALSRLDGGEVGGDLVRNMNNESTLSRGRGDELIALGKKSSHAHARNTRLPAT